LDSRSQLSAANPSRGVGGGSSSSAESRIRLEELEATMQERQSLIPNPLTLNVKCLTQNYKP